MHATKYRGILFIEDTLPDARPIALIEAKINGGLFSPAQLKNLDDVKEIMAQKAMKVGANAIICFKYGQRSDFWTALFSLDSVAWYGTGTACELPQHVFSAILNSL